MSSSAMGFMNVMTPVVVVTHTGIARRLIQAGTSGLCG
jgi:hypothetical protein